MSQSRVVGTSLKAGFRQVSLETSEGSRVSLKLHPYAVVGKGDQLLFDGSSGRRISVRSQCGGAIPLLPAFSTSDTASLGDITYELTVRELLDQSDIDAYDYLEKFHYKTSLHSEDEDAPAANSGGRKAVLLLSIKHGKRWVAAGYVELVMPLLMVKPRHDFFQAAPFHDNERGISWDKWDGEEIRRYTNHIVRIGRIVISPEYRGLGLAKNLLKIAGEFARERWHIGGKRPIFLEISAEMLNYIDFVSTAGFTFIGLTEGNLRRVVKDLHYMRREYEVASGIMSLQRRYLVAFEKLCRETGKTFDEQLEKLKRIADDPAQLNSLDPGEWYAFRRVLRFPRPYYLLGLNNRAREYLQLHRPPGIDKSPSRLTSYTAKAIEVKLRSVRSVYDLPSTPNVRMITESFGIETRQIARDILGSVTVKAAPGNIIFVAGASGSGKSVLLRSLDGSFHSPHLRLEFEASPRGQYSAGWLQPIDSSSALIEVFADRYGADRTVAAFSRVGLSEAFVFLKPFELLSRGQRYRAMIADLMLRDDPVWLIDEFCADLDPVAASIVAHNLRKLTLREGRIAVLAAANHSHFLKALRPTQILIVRAGDRPEYLSHRDYSESYGDQRYA